ncbi:Appr-1-p processing domain protein [Nitrosococcus halophilus Nc 4]|uniref:Appr-1-p processing domain protein n=1 Tax=Nitrosococcus halophilus (strain Nc4) TaxID=472759 RepID=D5C185_NITHN|nr:macro domain-containing protein [Nitrosococcus halophilus]ADE16437.1 Appr-1-p processing domain protein [Nitrosococcus halophilus Nc 4]
MIEYTKGNLLKADVEALVNTVNTVGIMGKGIALMFKEAFKDNFDAYAAACKAGEVKIGQMFTTETGNLMGPQWIINFPTKKHWRNKTKLAWIEEGLEDLRRTIIKYGIDSIAIPPLGCGNGGLDWREVRPLIEKCLVDLNGIHILVYEPTQKYQNVAKRKGVQTLTPARALIAELVRRYWVLGIECSLLEIQKLAWFLERRLEESGLDNPLQLDFKANRYGPYADRLRHLLDALDGSYLRCDKRLADAKPEDTIAFNDTQKEYVATYLKSKAKAYLPALEATTKLIDGFESPLGMELLATVDWLLVREHCKPEVEDVKRGIAHWPASRSAALRKQRIFDDRLISLALERLAAY